MIFICCLNVALKVSVAHIGTHKLVAAVSQQHLQHNYICSKKGIPFSFIILVNFGRN